MKLPPLILLLSAVAFVASAAGAEHPPALKPLAEQFEKSRQALTASAETQLAPARDRYVASLATAQKAAAAAVKTTDLAVIASELEGVQAGTLLPEAPPDLPRALAGDRRAYTTAVANVARTTGGRQRELATKYLQSLVALEANALRAKDSALSEATAVEKQRVLALLEAGGGGAKRRNVVANGDFSQGEDGAEPPGWKNETEVDVTDATIVTEGTNKFLRFRRLQAKRRANLMPEKEIPVPGNTKAAEFSVRMRVKGLVPGKDWGIHPELNVSGRDARGEEVSKEAVAAKTDTNWRRFTGRVPIPATAKTIKVMIGPLGAAGVIDFDDIEVEFR